MKSVLCFVALLAFASAEEYQEEYEYQSEVRPEWYSPVAPVLRRQRRDEVYADKNYKVGDGKLFGQLGETQGTLYGKGGYERNLFDDHRGKLDGSIHGERNIGLDSSAVGGGLKWGTDNGRATLDVTRDIGGFGSTNVRSGGEWAWKLPGNERAELGAGAQIIRTPGFRDSYGGFVEGRYKF